LVVLDPRDEGNNIFNLVAMHHLLQELRKRSRGLRHDVFNFVSEFSIHLSLKLIDIDWSSLVCNDVFSVISFVKHNLELCEVVSSDESGVLFFSEETLGKSSNYSFWESIIDVLANHF
jgi:hypothetical protein